jgi:hypothetical protein
MTTNRDKTRQKDRDEERTAWRRRYPKYPPFDVQLANSATPSFFGARF